MPENTVNLENNINDLIGNPPGWMLRSGLTVLGLVVFIVLIMSGFIRYPDKISSTGIMTSTTPPLKHEAQASGLVGSIFINTNEQVAAGDTLVYIQNHADFNDIKKFAAFIQSFEQKKEMYDYAALRFPQDLILGDLQATYASLALNFSAFQLLINGQSTATEIELLKHELNSLKERRIILSRRHALTLKELKLKSNEFQRARTLHRERVTSDADFEKSNAEFLQFKKQAVQSEDELLLNKLNEERLNQQLFTLSENRSIDLNEMLFKLKELVSVLKLQLNEWTKKYVITAEISGDVLLNTEVIEHQAINTGQIIAYVIPQGANTKYVSARFPISGIGKIKKNDRAMVLVDGFPDKEYGRIDSYVTSITKVPMESNDGTPLYELNFHLPNDTIKTNYNITIPFKPNTTVVVEVITEDKSLLQRVFNQFLNLLKNQV